MTRHACCLNGAPVPVRNLAPGSSFLLHAQGVHGKVARVTPGSATVTLYQGLQHVVIPAADGGEARAFDAQKTWRGEISAGSLVHPAEGE